MKGNCARAIMLQGTGSDVGKSLLAAGLCRALVNRGYSVAPFKAQNMALNSGVTPDGLEMGRAQILQAECCNLEPDVRMNPVLLKPEGEGRSQLVRLGKAVGTYHAREYYTLHKENFSVVCDAFDSLSAEHDFIILEGAGSPAEINLQATDIVNMRMAEYAQADVYVVADIDRGGVFAWMKGTYDLVPEHTRHLIKGFIINKFRGDVTLLEPGIKMFEAMVPVPVVGVMKWCSLDLDEEDSQNIRSGGDANPKITVGVVRLPRMSNFTDFNYLRMIPGVAVRYMKKPEELDGVDIIVLPGSKNTIGDMRFVQETGFADAIRARAGQVPVIGICGGYQMLGAEITDPLLVEGEAERIDGLGLLPMVTRMEQDKTLKRKSYAGQQFFDGVELTGYEIHAGVSAGNPAHLQCVAEPDVCVVDAAKKLMGTYIHGIFDTREGAERILRMADPNFVVTVDYQAEKNRRIDQLAALMEEAVDIDALIAGNV